MLLSGKVLLEGKVIEYIGVELLGKVLLLGKVVELLGKVVEYISAR